jgi:predicted aconitase with swiveling domain
MTITGCKKIVGGRGTGKALVTSQPINFLAMVDAKTGRVTDRKHELYGKSLRGVVLVYPNAVGSSVGAYVFYSLAQNKAAPSAIACTKTDITTASGCAIANIPVVDLPAGARIKQGAKATVDADAGTIATV